MLLVERDDQLAELRRLFADCREGRSGVAVISGGVATGKTTLLRAACEHASGAGGLALGAVASSAEQNVPLGVIEQLLCSPGLPAECAEYSASWLSGSVLAASATGQATPGLPAIRQLWEIVKDLTDRAPTVISIDNAHYADEASLLCLLYSLRRLRSARLLVILTWCERAAGALGSLQGDFLREPHARRITVGPLSAAGVRSMLTETFGPATAREVAPIFHEVSGGHPTLVQAILEDCPGTAGRLLPSWAPGEALSRAVLDFLSRHEPPVADVAQVLAILGAPVQPALLGRLIGADAGSVSRAVGILTFLRILDDGHYRHQAVQAAVLVGAPASLRRAVRYRAAELLHSEGAEMTEIADHLVGSGGECAHWALSALSDAAEQALGDDDTGAALRYLRAAHQMCADPRQRSRVAVALAQVEWRIDPGIAVRHLPEATAAIGAGLADERRVGAAIVALLWNGQIGEALEIVGKQSPAGYGAAAPGADGLGTAQSWLAFLYPREYQATHPAEPGQDGAPGHGLADPADGELASYLAGMAGQQAENRVVVAREVLERCQLGEQTVALLLLALAILTYSDEFTLVATRCDALASEAARRQSPTWQALFTAIRALVHLRRGELAAAAERSDVALTVIPTRSWGVAVGLPIACAVRARTALGELDEASTLLRLPVPAEMFLTFAGLHYLYARGEYNLAARRYDAALHDFRSCEPLVTGWTSSPAPAELWRVGAARACLSLGTPAEAQRLIDQQLAQASSRPPRARAYSLRVLADMQGPTARAALLEKVLPLLRECGDLYGAWRTASDLSDACAPLGLHERSRLLAQEAQVMGRRCLGLDPGQVQEKDGGVPSACWHRLSVAEQRVAVLAAQGHSNREISQKLFITVSTVEQHLTRIYRKLNVRRLQLHAVITSRPEARPDGDRR